MSQDSDNVKLAVLEEKVFNMVELISKLDDTIEKLSDLSVNVTRMLAVHEEKLEFARESAAETAKEMEDMEDRIQEQLDTNSKRLRTLERRFWVGLGVILTVGVLLQSEIVMKTFDSKNTPAIMEGVSRP